MNFKNNATYRFICRADKNRSLNVYGDSGSVPSAQTNVCLYTSNANDTCQQWIYKESGGNKYFVCKKNPNLALDMYTGSTSGQSNVNAHVIRRPTPPTLRLRIQTPVTSRLGCQNTRTSI